jgi:hypothetical protein
MALRRDQIIVDDNSMNLVISQPDSNRPLPQSFSFSIRKESIHLWRR